MKISSVWKNIAVTSVLSGLGAISGLLFYSLIITRTGIAGESDAFFIAFSIPSLFYAMYLTSQQVLITFFSKIYLRRVGGIQKKIIDGFLSFSILILAFLAIFCYLFVDIIIASIAPGLSNEEKSTAIYLLQIMTFLPLMNGVSIIYGSLLAANEKFLLFSAQNLVRYLVATIVFFFNPQQGVSGAAFGLVIGSVCQLILIISACKWQVGYSYKPTIRFGLDNFLDLGRMIKTTVTTSLIRQLSPLSTRFIASFFPPGSVAILDLAMRIQGPITSIFFSSIISTQLPKLSKVVATRVAIDINDCLAGILNKITLIAIPVGVVVLATNTPIVVFLYGSGGSLDISGVFSIVFLYNIGVFFRGYYSFILSYFYSTDNSRELLFSNIFITVVDLISKILFSYIFGLIGIAIASSLSLFLSVFWGGRVVNKYTGVSLLSLSVIKIISLLFIMAIAILIGGYVANIVVDMKNISILNYSIAGILSAISAILTLSIFFLLFRKYKWI